MEVEHEQEEADAASFSADRASDWAMGSMELFAFEPRETDPCARQLASSVAHHGGQVDVGELIARFPSIAKFQEFPKATVDGRLVTILNEFLCRGRFPRRIDDVSRISSDYFQKALGLSDKSIRLRRAIFDAYDDLLDLVEPIEAVPLRPLGVDYTLDEDQLDSASRSTIANHPELRKHQFYQQGRNAHSIVRELNRQLSLGKIEWSRGGKISRAAVCTAVGISATGVNDYLPIFSDYEDALGKQDSMHYYKIPAMRDWFEKTMEEGSLLLNDGRFNRKQFYAKFELYDSLQLERYPLLRDLFDEYDSLIKATGYVPKDVAQKLEALQKYLATAFPPKGFKLSRMEIRRKLGLTARLCDTSPFREAIAAAEDAIKERIVNDPLTCIAHPRTYKFHFLVSLGWPEHFAKNVKDSFERHYKKKGREVKSYFQSVTELFKFLADAGVTSCRRFKEALDRGVPVKYLAREWSIVTLDFRDELASRTATSTLKTRLMTTNSVLRNLGNDGVLPPLDLPLTKPRVDSAKHLLSVAEVTSGTSKANRESDVDDYLRFAMSMLDQASRTFDLEVSATDGDGFNAVLRQELTRERFAPSDNPAVLIQRIIDHRLKLIEQACLTIVENERKRLDIGERLLSIGVDPGQDLDLLLLNNGSLNQYQRKGLLRRYFPLDDENRGQGLANLLKVCATRYRYLYPKHDVKGGGGQFFRCRKEEYANQP
jgi:hypothetical protein